MWEIFALCALGRWRNEGGESSLKTKPQVSWSLGIYEDIYFLRARVVNRNRCQDVCQEENEWGCRKQKEPFLQVEEEGRDGWRARRGGMGAASKGDP